MRGNEGGRGGGGGQKVRGTAAEWKRGMRGKRERKRKLEERGGGLHSFFSLSVK